MRIDTWKVIVFDRGDVFDERHNAGERSRKMIREAAVMDSVRIAEIDVTSSRYAYQDILSHKCLRDLSVENRIPVYERWIKEKRFEIYVYEDADTRTIRGMMGIGPCEGIDKPEAFELHLVYVDPDYVRKGIGSEMLRFFEQKGKQAGCREYVVWVLEENEMGRHFYEKNGFHPDGKEKVFRRWNKREIRYVKS